MKTKILQVSHSFSDNRLPPKNIATILNNSGVKSSICYLFDNGASEEQMTAYNHCKSSSFNINKKSRSNNKLSNFIKLYNLLKNENYDTVITHRYKPFFLTLILSMFFKETKFCAIFHGNGTFKRKSRRWICRLLLRDNWALISVSKSVQNDINSTLGKTKAKQKVIYNCLDMAQIESSQFTKEQAREQLNLDQHVFIFGCIARLVPGKGIHHLIAAFAKLQTSKNVQLAIIGDGREKGALLQQLQDLDLQNKVIFCGYRENAVHYATAFDTFILPTTNEGFGLVLLEAAIARIPLIASEVGGVPEVASETEIILVPTKDENALLQEMTIILKMSNEERNQLGQKTYEQLQCKFDITQVAPEYHRLLGL